MTHQKPASPSLSRGDIVYFTFLHLDTAHRCKSSTCSKEQTYIYEVEGKARPMLVFRDPSDRHGVNWYHVFRFTTKGLEENGKLKKRHRPMGNLIHPETTSYIVDEPQWYPENLLSVEDGKSPVIKQLDRLGLNNLEKILAHEAL